MSKRMNLQKDKLRGPAIESKLCGEYVQVERGDQSFHPSVFFWRGQIYTIAKITHSWPDSEYGKNASGKKH